MEESFVKDIVYLAKDIYSYLSHISLMKKTPISLICVGQSPAYLALAMRYIRQYNSAAVEVLVLPYSKHGSARNISAENEMYIQRLTESGVQLRNNVFILDYIISGNGILSFKNLLTLCYPNAKFSLISLNETGSNHTVPVLKQFKLRNLNYLLENSERIVQHYSPLIFFKEKIICDFINLNNNALAAKVIDAAIFSLD